MFYFGKRKKKAIEIEMQPIQQQNDIQPGVSPEIIEEFTLEPEKVSRGFFGNIFNFGYGNEPSLQETYRHSLYEKVQEVSARLLPMRANSTGHLTSEEFVQAGDYLVKHNLNWEWTFEPENMNGLFPPDKQFLINRGLICYTRIDRDLEERVHLNMEKNEIWTCPVLKESSEPAEIHIYDASITYDIANRTPRVWMSGYSETGKPLSMEEVAADMDIMYVGTSATINPHPFTGILNVSIHPCHHATAMTRLILEQPEFQIEQYLMLFINLITGIFPTIDMRGGVNTPS